MKFDFTQTREDGAGTLTVTAENQREVAEVADHFKMFDKTDAPQLIQLAQAITAGTLTYTSKPSAKRPWFLVESSLAHDYTKPYEDLLNRITGYEGPLPDMDLTPFNPRQLIHTHITSRCALDAGHYSYTILIQAEDWNGKPAHVRAEINAQDYAEEDLGYRPFEREFIEGKNGSMKHNPDYLKRHRAKPATGAPWLWSTIFHWWRLNHASDAQCAALDQAEAARTDARLNDRDFDIRDAGRDGAHLVGLSGLYLSMKEPVRFMKWEEFKQLA